MSWKEPELPLSDFDQFETLNGLWKGKKEPFVEAGVIRNTNFTASGVIDYSDVAYLQVEERQLQKRLLESGDIILERSGGGPKQPVGRVVLFDRDTGIFSFSNFTTVIRIRDRKAFDPKFIFYGLMKLYQSGRTEDIQRRTTGIRNLDFTAYKNRARFPQIGLSEQKKITHILSMCIPQTSIIISILSRSDIPVSSITPMGALRRLPMLKTKCRDETYSGSYQDHCRTPVRAGFTDFRWLIDHF